MHLSHRPDHPQRLYIRCVGHGTVELAGGRCLWTSLVVVGKVRHQ